MIKKKALKYVESILLTLACFSILSFGFASWILDAPSQENNSNLFLIVDDVSTASTGSINNLALKNSHIRFDAKIDDTTGKVTYIEDIGGEQLDIYIEGTISNYSDFGSLDFDFKVDIEKESLLQQLVQSNYLSLPIFQSLNRESLMVSNEEKIGSFWSNEPNTIDDTRQFYIHTRFTWGTFFNEMNPSLFFDSSQTNGIKIGNVYSLMEQKEILNSLYLINETSYYITLNLNPIEYSLILNIGENATFNSPTFIGGLTRNSTITLPNEIPVKEGYTFKGWWTTLDANLPESEFYKPGQTFLISSLLQEDATEVSLYAQWSDPIIVTIHFTKDGNFTGNDVTLYFDYNESFKLDYKGNLSDTQGNTVKYTVNSGYSFSKWSWTHNGNTGEITNENELVNLNQATFPGLLASPELTIQLIGKKNSTACIYPDSKILMADGSYKLVQDIQVGDFVQVWSFETGQYENQPIIYYEHLKGYETYKITIYLDDGSFITVADSQAFFDLNLKDYFVIDKDSLESALFRNIATYDKNILSSKKIINYSIELCYEDVFEMITAYDFNFFYDSILTVEPFLLCYNYFSIGDDFKFIEELKQQDIEKYGLFDYEFFDELLTKEQFTLFNVTYFSIAIGKGLYTPEFLIEMIYEFLSEDDRI